jgi:hypothetical protein
MVGGGHCCPVQFLDMTHGTDFTGVRAVVAFPDTNRFSIVMPANAGIHVFWFFDSALKNNKKRGWS